MALGYHIASRLHSIIGRVSTGLVHWSLGYKPLTHWISLGRTGTSGRHFFGKPRKYWTVVSLTAVPANLSSPKFFFKFSGVRPCSTWDTLPQNKQNNWMCSWVICVPIKIWREKKLQNESRKLSLAGTPNVGLVDRNPIGLYRYIYHKPLFTGL